MNSIDGIILILTKLRHRIELQENSTLKKYLDSARQLSAEQRGKLLEGFEEISSFHQELALEGQTDANSGDPVDHHFVAFVNHQGDLYELDGRKSFPVKHGSTSADTLLEVNGIWVYTIAMANKS